MNVALDIDGTISEHPEFFAVLSAALRKAGHRVLVLTYRDPARGEATRAQLTAWGIEFDDQDECIAAVPENVLVCKVRNGGNFDFASQRWLSTGRLTRLIR